MATTASATSTASNSSTSTAASSSTGSSGADRLQSLSVQDFTKMLIAELQNQDPSQPMSNTELLQQVSQIRSISSNDQLNTTLQSVLLGQNLSSAGTLIGRTVNGLDSNGQRVSGPVTSVSISGNSSSLNVGNSKIDLANVTSVSATSTGG